MTSHSTTEPDRENSESTPQQQQAISRAHTSTTRKQPSCSEPCRDSRCPPHSGSSMPSLWRHLDVWLGYCFTLGFLAPLALALALYPAARRLLSSSWAISRDCLRSLAYPRWVLFWLCVSSLIVSCLFLFMPQDIVVAGIRNDPLRFLQFRMNAIFMIPIVILMFTHNSTRED